jgi:hypothetical protein
MKFIARMLLALKRTTASNALAPKETKAPHIAEACPTVNDAAPAASLDNPSSQVKDEHQVTMRLAYAGEDAKYLKVEVAGKTIKIAKSRVQFELEGDEAVVTMTKRYAASRPELAGQQ